METNGEKHELLKSTQARLKELLLVGKLPLYYYVMATEQTEGRGRSDHQWDSVKGNLHVSILINEIPFSSITWTPLWIATCLVDALIELGVHQNRLKLKWPNDLWIDGLKKAGGILCEKVNDQIIVGVGLNLIHAPVEGSGIVPSAQPLESETVTSALIEKLKKPITVQNVKDKYAHYSMFLSGMEVTWRSEINQESNSGLVVGLGDFGELKVMTQNGVVSLFSEDVQAVRQIVK